MPKPPGKPKPPPGPPGDTFVQLLALPAWRGADAMVGLYALDAQGTVWRYSERGEMWIELSDRRRRGT